jgi:hypothetical protein
MLSRAPSSVAEKHGHFRSFMKTDLGACVYTRSLFVKKKRQVTELIYQGFVRTGYSIGLQRSLYQLH